MTLWIIAALTSVILLTHPYIDLEAAIQLGPWHANAPIADIAALALLPFVLRRPAIPLPGPRGYALFIAAGVASVYVSAYPYESIHFMVRKPLFFYLVYGIGMARAVTYLGPRDTRVVWSIAVALASIAVVSAFSSIGRIGAGNALWFQGLDGLTPNHKTLAVVLAGWLPLLLVAGFRGGPSQPDGWALGPRAAQIARWLAIGCGLAILASASKTAALTAAVAVGLIWPRERPICLRLRVAIPAGLIAVLAAYYAPVVIGSKTMIDAARSRHSLNRRAATMVVAHPIVGSGGGTSTLIKMTTFPHYRINGVDAHGVVQKIISETGLVGLAGYTGFVYATLITIRRRWDGRPSGPDYAVLGTWVCLHTNLLLSTETFSPTHWTPFAVAWGLAHRNRQTTGRE